MHNPLGSGFFILNNKGIGKIKSSLDRLFEKKGGAKGRKEGKSRRLEIHSEGCICRVVRCTTKMGGYTESGLDL